MRPIKLYWAGGKIGRVNFGDTLSPLMVSRLSGREVRFATVGECDMIAIGSILDNVLHNRWKRFLRLNIKPIQVWGSGLLYERTQIRARGIKFAAVRGQNTRHALGLGEDVALGDPGILSPLICDPPKKNNQYGIVPHISDIDSPHLKDFLNRNDDALLIDVREPDISSVIRKIAACDFIISSSLHGLIVADAFSVPNLWVRIGNRVLGDGWKFLDYYSSINRKLTAPLQLDANLTPHYLESKLDTDHFINVRAVQDKLLAAFNKLDLD